MTWENKELVSKVRRIMELLSEGFNTPRFFFIRQGSIGIIPDFEAWANRIGKNRLGIFNIRTYTREKKMEGLKCPHITDIPANDVIHTINKMINDYHLMVDAEIPDDGRWAGNVLIKRNNHGRPTHFTIEWCHKEIRAMVREHNQGLHNRPMTEASGEHPVLKGVIMKAKTFVKSEPIILEWTWFCEGAGVKKENVVWWEYRKG